MVGVQDTLQERRNRFAKGFFALPLIFVAWGLVSLVWESTIYGHAVPVTWPPQGSGITYWVLMVAAFLVPLVIAGLLARGVALERAPILTAVIILGAIGVLLALMITGFAQMSGRAFIELFLTSSLLLSYCVVILHVRHVAFASVKQSELVMAPKTRAKR